MIFSKFYQNSRNTNNFRHFCDVCKPKKPDGCKPKKPEKQNVCTAEDKIVCPKPDCHPRPKPPPECKVPYSMPIVHDGGYIFWKRLSLLGILVCGAVACYVFYQKSLEPKERLPFVKYEYMYRRVKRFPWGEGVKSLFHNPCVNALPDGYEDVPECREYQQDEEPIYAVTEETDDDACKKK